VRGIPGAPFAVLLAALAVAAPADAAITARGSVEQVYARPSRLALPVVGGVRVATGLPPCPGLRGRPCRTYQPLHNREAR
jgi:hypothetical protein